MNTKQEVRRIRLSEPRTSWEDQGSSEVAAGKLEVMEKFFTPLPHSSGHRGAKGQRKKDTSWEGIRDQYYKECMSSSSTSSSSPWSSESNFGVRGRFSGYQPLAPQSRSCNDLSVARTRENEEKRDCIVKQKDAHVRKSAKNSAERLSPRIFKSEPTQKSNSGHTRNVALNSKSQQDDKRMLKNGGRRAKSMEALAAKETRKGHGNDRKKGTEEKQKFSRFLDEITIQVLSPSNLNSLGVKEKHRSPSNREQWKNSSTDSSGSRGKRTQYGTVVEQQEVRRKGKGKSASSTKTKMGIEPPVPCRSRDMSTSPDSVSSSTWRRGEKEDANFGVSNASHQPRASCRLPQEKGIKSGNITELPKEKKETMISGGGVLKGKVQYSDTAQNSECTAEPATKVPITTQSSWWGGPGGPVLSPHSEKNVENFTDTSRRKNEKFSGTHSNVQIQDTDHQSSTQTENLEQDKESLNQKITELLDHLVRAQSTICALEKLNVSSLLRHLPADVLESMKNSQQGPGIQTEGPHDFKSSGAISLQTSSVDICSGDLKCSREESKEEGNPAPRLTAFTPWSPRRQRSFLALHTLYNSTESECSLEDTLPPCKLLSPRFPNLGESFSDDRNDDGNSDNSDPKTEQKFPGALKPSPSLPNLLPTHRIPQTNHHVRVSSSESSGEDTLINWVDMRSQDSALDYMSAQKILDTLLGLTTPSDRFATPKPQNLIDFSSKIEGHVMRSEIQLSNNPKGNSPRNDLKNIPHSASNQNDLHNYTERSSKLDNFVCSHYNPLYSPNDELNRKLQSTEFITPPLLAKRSSFSGTFADTCPLLNPVAEVGFRPLGKTEGTDHHRSIPPSSLSVHDHPIDPPSQCIPFVLRSPSGSESIVGTWQAQHHGQEGGREKKTKKERTVTFDTMINDGQPKHGQVTVKSKFMPNRFEDHGQGDSSLDSTLL